MSDNALHRAVEQELCAAQFHEFIIAWDGKRRCRCGAVHPNDYIATGDPTELLKP